MTRHYKLENGNLIQFNSDGSDERIVESVGGVLTGIVPGRAQINFIFSDGDDFNRLYLDYGGKPETRLLMLFVSKLERLENARVFITSDTREGAGRHASRLHLTFTDNDEQGEAPYYLPEGAEERNDARIRAILDALSLVEDTGVIDRESETASNVDVSVDPEPASGEAPERDVDGSGETGREEALVIEGVTADVDGGGAAGAGRTVRLVASHPVFALVYDGILDEGSVGHDDELHFIRCVVSQAGLGMFRVEHRNFSLSKSADAFCHGVRSGVRLSGGRFDKVLFVRNREDVNSLLQAYAERMNLV